MESGFLTFILVSSFAVHSFHSGITDWDDVVVARAGSSTTLVCTDATVRGPVTLNWMVKSLGAKEWKLVLSASESNTFSGGASKASMQLTESNFQGTGVFSLSFCPKMEDGGLYSCLIQQQERKLKERILLLAILTVTVLPSPIIPKYSTLRLIARVTPDITKITWISPDGISIKSENTPNVGTEAKLPLVQHTDNGVYICMVHPLGNSSIFPFSVNITVDAADKVVSLTDNRNDTMTSTATRVRMPLLLNCPSFQGDFVRLQWQPPDTRNNMQGVIQYDRWRDSTSLTKHSRRVQLAGPPYNSEAGSFAFLLKPELNEGGLYACEVFLNDKPSIHSTMVSVMKVKTKRSSSKLELSCLYSERSQVRSVKWKHQNTNRQLQMSSNSPGSITTTVPLPITPDTAGNYTCTLKLKNGQTICAMQAVTLPPEGGRDVHVGVTAPPMLPSLSALLLLVPLVAAAVGVLLWRQKQISDHDIEYSLSVQSGEVENIYENPDDIRQQGPPQGSVYMDLKPRGEDDVYKELERYEQCQS
ncbi:g6f-like isoform X2 [Paralichthys olivaceus]|uniref:g6f-like isoform X2 n=2 Tax=Paralichthys olivaceus TaxID=8255 RepID=UPI0037504E26